MHARIMFTRQLRWANNACDKEYIQSETLIKVMAPHKRDLCVPRSWVHHARESLHTYKWYSDIQVQAGGNGLTLTTGEPGGTRGALMKKPRTESTG
jgi:hypothetical protein